MRDIVAKRRPMIDLEQFERRLRQPTLAPRADEDPLTELARLAERPEDPYSQVFEARPAHRVAEAETREEYAPYAWEEPEAPDFAPDNEHGEYASIDAGPLARNFDEDAGLRAFAADEQAEHWRDGEDAAEFDPGEETETRSRRPLYIMAAIIVAGIGGIGATFALKGGPAPQQIATIKAPDGPVKVEPEPTGADAPARSASILERTPQAAPVAVADATEQPIDLSRLPDRALRTITPGGSGAASVPVPPSPAQGLAPAHAYAPAQPAAAPQGIAGLIEPKKVKTVSVRPDGSVLPGAAAPLSASTDAQALARMAAPAPAPAAKAATPKSTARVATTPKPAAAPAAEARQKPVQVAEADPAAAGATNGGGYAVQLAAPDSEQEARDIQMRLIKKYGADIPGFHPSIRKAVSGDKTVYRVRNTGLTRDDATALCQKVLSAGGKCFVARN